MLHSSHRNEVRKIDAKSRKAQFWHKAGVVRENELIGPINIRQGLKKTHKVLHKRSQCENTLLFQRQGLSPSRERLLELLSSCLTRPGRRSMYRRIALDRLVIHHNCCGRVELNHIHFISLWWDTLTGGCFAVSMPWVILD